MPTRPSLASLASLASLVSFAPLAAAALLAACSPQKQAAKPQAGQALSPMAKLNTDLPMDEFMGHMVDPAAFMYWKGSGTMVDAQGEHDLSPAPDDQEGWDGLISGATILMEAGNMLQLEGRRRAPEADWNRYAQMLTERALAARKAAEAHDKQGTFTEGA